MEAFTKGTMLVTTVRMDYLVECELEYVYLEGGGRSTWREEDGVPGGTKTEYLAVVSLRIHNSSATVGERSAFYGFGCGRRCEGEG